MRTYIYTIIILLILTYTIMSMTLEIVMQRVEAIEKQMQTVMDVLTENNLVKTEKIKSGKKSEKKTKKKELSESDEEKPKVKRISGYILFSKAMRDDATEKVRSEMSDGDAKIKSTDIMKELGRMWKELSEEDKEPWNSQAKEQKEESVAAE